MATLTQKVASNTIIQVIGKVITTVIGLVTVGLLTRFLGLDQYGTYTIVFAYVALAAVLADLGFYVIMLRELSQPGADQERIASNVLTLRVLLGTVVFGLAFLVALAIPNYSADVRWGIAIIGLATLLTVCNQVYVGIFQTHLRMDRAVLGEVVGRIVVLGLLLWLLGHSSNLIAVFWVYVVANAANLLASVWLARSTVRLRSRFEFTIWKRIATEALPMGFVLILFVIYFRLDSIMLSLLKSPADVGIYGAPYKILEILLILPSIFLGNLFPTLSNLAATRHPRLGTIVSHAFQVLILAAIPILVVTVILAEPILALVAGQSYVVASTVTWLGAPATAVTTLQILAWAVACSFLANLPSYLVVAAGAHRRLILPNLLFVGVNILTNLILIPRFSYVGAALATLGTELVALVVLWLVARRIVGYAPAFGHVPRLLLAAVTLAAVTWLVADLSLLVSLPLVAIVYGLLLHWLNLFPPQLLARMIRS